MRRANSERGEGRLGTLFALVLLAVIIYLGFKVVPVMINSYTFKDFMEEEARFAMVRAERNEPNLHALKPVRHIAPSPRSNQGDSLRSSEWSSPFDRVHLPSPRG